MEIPITYSTFLLINYRKKIIRLNLLIVVVNPRVMAKLQTDRMRIDGENYEYHEQTKQMSHLSIWLQIIANNEYTIVVKMVQCRC